MTLFLAACLYPFAFWFALGAVALAIAAANRPGFRTRAILFFLAAMTAVVAVVQVLAAGDLR